MFPPNEPPTRPDTGRYRMQYVRAWWQRGSATPWVLLFNDATLVRAKRFRVVAGHVKSASLSDGAKPLPLPASMPAPAGWLEILGEVVFDE